MGRSEEGTAASWEEVQRHSAYIRGKAVEQFIRLYQVVEDRTCDVFKWGDETEYMMMRLDHKEKTARIILDNDEVVKDLEREDGHSEPRPSTWVVETPAHMVESLPWKPFTDTAADFASVEKNLFLRRRQLNAILQKRSPTTGRDEEDIGLCITAFPRYGFPGSYIAPRSLSELSRDGSIMAGNEIHHIDYATPYPRNRSMCQNITERRGGIGGCQIPIFKDIATDIGKLDGPLSWNKKLKECTDPTLDSPLFAFGVSATQVTVQGKDLEEARMLHDQLLPISPIMMALSAATPILHGYLTEWDCRWNVPRFACDCRTAPERGLEPLQDKSYRIPKSRFGTSIGYVSSKNASLNDVHFPYHEETYKQLSKEGIDCSLARYMARLFVQDPLYMLEEHLSQDASDIGHLQNFLMTNWQLVRLKVPPEEGDVGWRAEFRTMEVQLTDFEQAAYINFMILLTKAITALQLDFVIPISQTDANMDKAPLRDALRKQEFLFRVEPFLGVEERIVCEMSIDVIINGGLTKAGIEFPGLVPLVRRYLTTLELEENGFRPQMEGYLTLICDRAAGRVPTTAQWTRDFVQSHQDYQNDSAVTERINYDLMKICNDISQGRVEAPHLSPY